MAFNAPSTSLNGGIAHTHTGTRTPQRITQIGTATTDGTIARLQNMQRNNAVVQPPRKLSGRSEKVIDDIYDIPTSRETTPTAPQGNRASRTVIRTEEGSGKKRKHSSAFSNPSAMGRQQSSRPQAKPDPEAAPATVDSSVGILARKNVEHGSPARNITLLPSVPVQPSKPYGVLKGYRSTLSPKAERSTTQPPRRRLIDTLAAQRTSSPDSGTGSDSDSDSDSDSESRISKAHVAHAMGERTYNSPSPQIRLGAARTPDRRGGSAKNRKIKLTYSSSRSFLGGAQSQPDIFDDTSNVLPSPDAEDPFATPLSPPPADYEIDDEPDGPRVGIQSVHELRRAGANNRFSDEMDDLLSRIGKPLPAPSALRRNALCELAKKLQRKEFAIQFRDHAARDNTVRAIGSEGDIISGFALAAALVTFLTFSPAPHLLRQLTAEKVGTFLGHLFREQRDVEDVSTQKQANLSHVTKSSLASLKMSILQMNIWHGQNPSSLSPRTLALQLLVILSRCADVQCLQSLTADVEHDITSMVLAHSKEHRLRNVDYVLIILALEAQSNLISLESERYSVAIKGCLQATLEAWLQQDNISDNATLKLAINITNSEIGASTFDDSSLLSNLIHSISQGTSQIQSSLQQGAFQNKLYDELLLILGIVINILEHCASARKSVDGRSLDTATTLWLSNMAFFDDVDSVGKSKIGVALGYLAIVLGYLYLTSSGRSQMRKHQDWPGISHLINSIQEFLRISKTIGNRTHELETLVSDLQMQQAMGG